MADFLDRLPVVPLNEVPENNSECSICLCQYGTAADGGIIEQPIRLPVSSFRFPNLCYPFKT